MTKVTIDPHCVFCREYTDNVVMHTVSNSFESGGGFGYKKYQVQTLTIPVPAHQTCYDKERNKGRLPCLLSALLVLPSCICMAIATNGFSSVSAETMSLGQTVFSLLSAMFALFIVPVLGIVAYMFYRANGTRVERTIFDYYKTHLIPET